MPFDTPDVNPSGANYRLIYADLCSRLPDPPGADPDIQAKHRQLAMDAVAALNPYDALEALLAVRVVSAEAHAADAFRAAALAADDPDRLRQCRAQAASMARTSDSALRALMRLQAKREKQEAEMHPSAMEKAGYWFRSASVPPKPAPAAPEQPPPTESEPVHTQASIDADAKLYAVMYPDRAARIRAEGGLPARLDFGPPEPEIVAALLRSRPPAAATAPVGRGTVPASETMRHP